MSIISIQILWKKRCSSKIGTLRKSLLDLHKYMAGIVLTELVLVAVLAEIKLHTVADRKSKLWRKTGWVGEEHTRI